MVSTKKRRAFQWLMSLSLIFCLMLGCAIDTFATNVSFRLTNSTDATAFDQLLAKGTDEDFNIRSEYYKSDVESKSNTTLFGTSKGTYTFNQEAFSQMTKGNQNKVMKNFIRALKNSDVSASSQTYIVDQMRASDDSVATILLQYSFDGVSADTYTAMKIISPLLSAVRIILGVLTITIVALLIFSTVLDLMFLGFPLFSNYVNSKMEEKGKGGDKPSYITKDAYNALQESEGVNGDHNAKNIYGVYFKKRAVSYVIFGVCVVYLVVGELGGLVGKLVDLVSGLTSLA